MSREEVWGEDWHDLLGIGVVRWGRLQQLVCHRVGGETRVRDLGEENGEVKI